jgi:hypothetical protein
VFAPKACFKGAALVWVITAMCFHSAAAGLAFAVWPLGFGVAGLLRR